MVCAFKSNKYQYYRRTGIEPSIPPLPIPCEIHGKHGVIKNYGHFSLSYRSSTVQVVFINRVMDVHIQSIFKHNKYRDRMVVEFITTYAISAYHH
jgi:hypothetical protein